jgi:hypothetical protein
MMSTADTWKQLETSPSGPGGGYLSRRIHPGAVVDLFLAVEKPSNTRLLVIRVAGVSVKAATDLPRAEGFEVRRGLETVEGKKHYHLSVRQTHTRFADVFATLVDDVVSHVVRASGEHAAVRVLLDRLERWQAFLKKHAAEGLGDESQQGLFGELWFLGSHAIPRLGTRLAVCCWKGPTGAPQDFQIPSVSVEVKTASGKQHQKLTISNERQLDPTGIGVLLVFHLSVDVREGSGESLPARVGAVRVLVEADAVAAEELERLLFEAGYLDCHAHVYDARGYTIRETNFFEVRDGFPRVVEADLRSGVGDVRYTISVAECRHYAVPESRVHQLFDEAARGN